MTVDCSSLALGTFPTPVHRVEGVTGLTGELWVKRDDASAVGYGGNKVRKLERILAAARVEGSSRLITVGAAGSHHVVATAYFGSRSGFAVDAVLVPQIATPHVMENLRAVLGLGTNITVASTFPSAALHVLAEKRADAYYVHLGGSSVVGTLGYVSAAEELAQQIQNGECEKPDEIVLALGSGGTMAGLLVGFAKMGLAIRVRGVCISKPTNVLGRMMRHLVKKVAKRERVDAALALSNAVVDEGWVGQGYGSPTKEGESAYAEADSVGIGLDATYTAKAFAAALHRARTTNERVLFWHTLSSAPMAPLLEHAPSDEDVRRRYAPRLL